MSSRKLRYGYTTGSCAAAATKAALYMLFTGETIAEVLITTPNQTTLHLEVKEIERATERVTCGIKKDAGDDPDVTNGVMVYAKVSKTKHDIVLNGGAGIGRVTRKGLQQGIGEAAINQVPRKMILKEVRELCRKYQYYGGLEIIISIPEGEALASQTFNPRLGIVGGISVLGTTGIVEPMSEKALTDTIKVELKFLKENGHEYCYIVPGNYGIDFLTEQMKFRIEDAIKCSNYIGETIELAIELGLKGVLLVGHIGKFVKLAAGIMNTHSKIADGRMEILGVHAALAGAARLAVKDIMDCITTAEALELLEQQGVLTEVMSSIMKKIEVHLKHQASGKLQVGAIVFSEKHGVLGQTSEVAELIRLCQRERAREEEM